MWVIKVEDFLNMFGPPLRHQELLRQGLLVERQPGFHVIFVSHQWLGRDHPDETGAQTEVLRGTLQSVIDGRVEVDNSISEHFTGNTKQMPPPNTLRKYYIWLDWFSVPQGWGNRQADYVQNILPYIQSIPAYIESSDIFVALVPKLLHNDTGKKCDGSTWHRRGWCRTEMWCKLLLSCKHPIVVIYGKNCAQFATPMDWINFYVHEGEFRSEADHKQCREVVRRCLEFRMAQLSRNPESLQLYRYYAARFEDFLNLPVAERTPSLFLTHFNFRSMEEAVKQNKGMGAVACAAASGDIKMLQFFIEAGAPVATPVGKDLLEVEVQPGSLPLHLAVRRGIRGEATAAELLKLRADPGYAGKGLTMLPPLCFTHSPGAVDILVQHRADINFQAPPLNLTPITAAAMRGAPLSVLDKLLECRADANLCKGGAGMPILAGLSILGTGPNGLESAKLLVEAKADVNLRFETSGFFRALELVSRGRMMLRFKEPPLMVKWFSDVTSGSTPLGVACFCGNVAMVEFLLQSRADPYVKNHRGRTPLHMARHAHTRAMLIKILQDPQKRSTLASSPVEPSLTLQEAAARDLDEEMISEAF